MKIFLKTNDEIQLMREANQLVGKTLAELAKYIKPGVTTLQLDNIAEEFIRDHGAIPTFKNFPNPFGGPFPASICTSVNDVVVHGIPDNKTVLRDGDIISIDCGTLLNGYNGDSCYTFCVGDVAPEVRQLVETTKEALYKGIAQAVAGKHIGDIGDAVQSHCVKWATVLFANLPVTVSDVKCTKTRRSRITVCADTVCCLRLACVLPLNR